VTLASLERVKLEKNLNVTVVIQHDMRDIGVRASRPPRSENQGPIHGRNHESQATG
jgi:hypothetical protein